MLRTRVVAGVLALLFLLRPVSAWYQGGEPSEGLSCVWSTA